MNTPNKLTLIRVVLAPVFLFVVLGERLPHRFLIAGIIFGLASITDALDGRIARKYNEITDFGKFLDPLADKMLVTAALIAFVELQCINTWIAMIIITREFLVTSLRLVAAGSGKVIAASNWGKAKTISQVIAILLILALKEFEELARPLFGLTLSDNALNVMDNTGRFVMWLAAILTVVSGIIYIWQHRDYIYQKK